MSKIKINLYATYLTIDAERDGTICEGAGHIRNVLDLLREMEFDQRWRRWQLRNRYYGYNVETRQFHLPFHIIHDLVQDLKYQDIKYSLVYHDPVATVPFDITMNASWTDREDHAEPIAHLSNKQLAMRACDLQTGRGKSQPLSTLIRVPGGWKRMGDLRVNDLVITPTGETTTIDGIYPQGKLNVYKVTFWDGRVTECSGDHLWLVFYINTSPHRRWRVVNTLELITLISYPNPRVYIPLIEAEDHPDTTFPIHPYLLGVFLGDGSSRSYTPTITTPDQFIVNKIEPLLPHGVHLGKSCYNDPSKCPTYRISKDTNEKTNVFTLALKELGLHEKIHNQKHIPSIYLEGSKEQRFNLLQGLMDTDGFVSTDGVLNYSTVSEQLAKDIQYLVRSLGGIASISTKIPFFTYQGKRCQGQLAYKVNIRHPKPSMCVTLPKKLERTNDDNQYASDLKLRVKSVERLGHSVEMQCISVDHPSRLYVAEDFIVTHNTYCAIRAVTELAQPTMVICDGLLDQWKAEFLAKTLTKEEDIYLLKGAPSIVKLMDGKKTPKIFIASIDTLRPYIQRQNAPYTEIPSYDEFLKRFNIGVKIVDEFHLNFSAIVSVDLQSNVKHNLYLSATPKRSKREEKKIFDKIFPPEIISGGRDYRRYVNITFYRYPLEFANQNRFKTIHGYSHVKYESYIANNPSVLQRFLFTVLFPLINSHYVNLKSEGQKLLIFCSTVAFCDTLKEYVTDYYQNLDVRTYTQADPEENLEQADIIISTPKSCGTGKDIANLRTVIQTCSMGSEPQVEQILGRLRVLKNGDTPEFVDIYNCNLSFHLGHYRRRSAVYKSRALKYDEHALA